MNRQVATVDGPFRMKLNSLLNVVSCSAGGTIATALSLDPDSQLTKWTTWDDLYEEFRVRSIACKVVCLGDGFEGATAFFIDEINPSSVPVLADTGVKRCAILQNSAGAYGGAGALKTIAVWRPSDFDDADWLSTSSPTLPEVAFKIYTDTTLGTAAVASKIWGVRFDYDIEFRLLKS